MATKRIKIACAAVEKALKQGNEINTVIKQGLPEDATVTDVRFDNFNRVIEIDVQGSFPTRGYEDFDIRIEQKQMPKAENKMLVPSEHKVSKKKQ